MLLQFSNEATEEFYMTIILLPFPIFPSLHTREFCKVLNTQIRCTQDSKTEVVCSYYINVNEDSIHVHHVIPYVIIVSFQMKGANRSIKSNPPSFTVHSSQSRIIPQRETASPSNFILVDALISLQLLFRYHLTLL